MPGVPSGTKAETTRFWLSGDQMVVERDLARSEGKTRHDIGRARFLERVWAWKRTYGTRISEQPSLLAPCPCHSIFSLLLTNPSLPAH